MFVVATPIGNLKDITLRALEVLAGVDAIVSENVRKTRNLLDHYDIKTRVMSYREENSERMGAIIVELLKSGKSVALVAEAGTPGVSDPGRKLVASVWREGLRVVPVPGASAAVAAISVSGMDEQRFVFEGFLPRRSSKRRQRLRDISGDCRQLVFFEAPHRLVECLGDIKAALGDRQCVLAREITKMYEDIERGSISSFMAKYSTKEPVGEFVIVCEGAGEVGAGEEAPKDISFDQAVREALALARGGLKKTDAAKIVAKKYRLDGGEIYKSLVRGTKPAISQGGRNLGYRGNLAGRDEGK